MFESSFADFLRQIPPIAFVMFCLSGIALAFVIVSVVIARRRRVRRLEALVASGGLAPGESQPSSGGFSVMGLFSGGKTMNSGMNDADMLPDLDDLTAPAAPGKVGAFSVRLADGSLIDAVEVLTVLRDIADGTLILQVGDRAYRFPAQTSADAEITRRIATVRDALGGVPMTAAVPPSIPTASADDTLDYLPVQPAIPPAADAFVPPVITPPVAPTATVIPGQRPGDLPKFKMPDQFEAPKRFGRVKRPDEIIPEINIAGAIEEYLQYKLTQPGPMQGRSLHIRSSAKGGIAIDVDGQFFEAVGDVADPAVRAFLQTAIQEWQDRQG